MSLDKYSNVVNEALKVGENVLAMQLRGMPVAKHTGYLKNLIHNTAWAPKDFWGSSQGQIWITLDDTLEKYAKLLFAAAHDDVARPYIVHGTLTMNPCLREKIFDAQTSIAIQCLDNLPKGYKDFRTMPHEQEGNHGDMVYKKTRTVLYTKLVESWAETSNQWTADSLMVYLINELNGHFRYEVAAIIRHHDSRASTERVEEALNMLGLHTTQSYSFVPTLFDECARSLSVRWIKSLKLPQVFRMSKLHQRVETLSEQSMELIGGYADLLKRIEHVANSFREEWKLMDFWKIKSIDPRSMEATLVYQVPDAYLPDRIHNVKDDLKFKISEWLNPDPAVNLQLELRGDVGEEKYKLLHKQRVRTTKRAA